MRSALDRLKAPAEAGRHRFAGVPKVAADTPREVPLTSFSILMAVSKATCSPRCRALSPSSDLKSGANILIGEDVGAALEVVDRQRPLDLAVRSPLARAKRIEKRGHRHLAAACRRDLQEGLRIGHHQRRRAASGGSRASRSSRSLTTRQ